MTLRELLAMAEARQRDAWAHTASILSLIANAHRDPRKTRSFKPADFDPFSARNKTVPTVGVLKTVFIDKRVPDLASENAQRKEAQQTP